MEQNLENLIMQPPLHVGFAPGYLWVKDYEKRLSESDREIEQIVVSVVGLNGGASSITLRVLTKGRFEDEQLTRKWVERVVKMLLWQRGGYEIWISDRVDLLEYLEDTYRLGGTRDFDHRFFSESVYHKPLQFQLGTPNQIKREHAVSTPPGQKTVGCRIGYDLGGSDRKCAAIIDGDVVFSEEIPWSPYHQKNPLYHIEGIRDSLRRAAKHLPRVDAIGGSSAGVIVDHVPEVGSLFRGLDETAMETCIRPFFRGLSQEWGGIPVTLLNDGEVTALAGAKWLDETGVLGIAMGTSLASGYVDPMGRAGLFLNELAFCPVDFDEDAPVDEWSGDIGCGVQYFSQQAVFRLAKIAGINVPEDLSAADKLKYVQTLAEEGEEKALSIFRQMGNYLGWTIPFWKQFYAFEHLLLLGRVVSGIAGDCILNSAESVMREHSSDANYQVKIHVPDETFKRHGQAIIAASIPQI